MGGGAGALVDGDHDGVPNVDDVAPADPNVTGWEGKIYHVLPFNSGPVSDPLDIRVRIRSADIYFMMDTTGSMQGEIDNLRNTLLTGNRFPAGQNPDALCPNLPVAERAGVLGAIRCNIPDAQFGVGYTDDVPMFGYGLSNPNTKDSNGKFCRDLVDASRADVAYTNLQNITDNDTLVRDAIGRLVASCGGDDPEAQPLALYSAVTGAGIPMTDWAKWNTGSTTQVPNKAGDNVATAYDLGNIRGTFKKYRASASGLKDDFSHTPCDGVTPDDWEITAADQVFKFTLDRTTPIVVIADGGADYNVQINLLNSTGVWQYCWDAPRYKGALFQTLPAGTHYIMFQRDDDNTLQDYVFWIGTWGTTGLPEYPPPAPACPEGKFGYPCFRRSSVPIILMMTDTTMHNGPSTSVIDDGAIPVVRYDYVYQGPSFVDAVHAMNLNGVKMIGINSGTTGPPTCSKPCLSGHLEQTDCDFRDVCNADKVQVCGNVRVCVQGTCHDEWQCRLECQAGTTRQWVCYNELVCDIEGPEVCTPPAGTAEYDLWEVARRTHTTDQNGAPLVYNIAANGTGMDNAIVTAINRLAEYSRLNVSIEAIDNPATALDERQFVESVATVRSAETDARCLRTHATWFESCLPGTQAKFSAVFRNDVTDVANAYDFNLAIIGTTGSTRTTLQSVPVRIRVPDQTSVTTYPPGWYLQNYQANCPVTERPKWGELQWSATLNPGTSLTWEIQTAGAAAALSSARRLSIVAPPATSPQSVSDLLAAGGVPNYQPFLRLTARLQPSADGTQRPVLHNLSLEYTCESNE